ncbi:cobalamin B12-binding domain-containing protein [Saccharicrinis fermentans]|uniref:Methionine synthase n=1 Tax=Saccharicrinis fermentans DSM 9555 = JCM 21142 TaxID=869213 RepID=W7Y1H8_9BACT|nr:corrinoid protein [Saccharicrinis fermentans]GAF04755.1 methionine synthase [Saccharicrinis fermentans DSM 9555 = JCM 21142]
MNELFEKLADCVEFGKINKVSPYPPNMKDQDGADEIAKQLLDQGVSANDILMKGLMIGMEKVGVKFRENKVFVPQVLMSAKAMTAALEHLKPYFQSGEAERKGTFIIGTVEGDLHDIGKNLVAMMVEGNGYEVIDLGTDVKAETFIEAAENNPGSVIGLSALLTTTMSNMEKIVGVIKEKHADLKVCIGGAPVNQDFCDRIGADSYNPDPQGVVEFLNALAS